MEFNNVNWVEVYNWARIIIPALAFVFAVYKYKKETSYKTTIQDFEQINIFLKTDYRG
ncbi:Uncharacterised protein [Neisseria zoodegmatis]|uniref:Uncharacterized protein n=1 Tax=Neisseria zoodegmatis TaxID=326523 RepID=A0A378WGA7_9NEIS|nr:Uncharacterised protein [Neisseria zoodegmatis]